MRRLVSWASAAVILGSLSVPRSLAQDASLIAPDPKIFSPGVISGSASDGAPTFTSDGKTLYFGRSGGTWGFILESHFNGDWSSPEIAPFSGQWSDMQPTLSADGNSLIFVSRRPGPDSTPGSTERSAGLWRVTREGKGWSGPIHLPNTVNISKGVFRPSLAANGDLYFMTKGDGDKSWRLYSSAFKDGLYLQAAPLPFSTGITADVDPEIAPDESFLIFSSAGRATSEDTHEHLYITCRSTNGWSPARQISFPGDPKRPHVADDSEPRLSPGGHVLYFTSGRTLLINPNRTREEADADFAKLNSWDNGNNNVWYTEFDAKAVCKR